jgi:hypothetical protein
MDVSRVEGDDNSTPLAFGGLAEVLHEGEKPQDDFVGSRGITGDFGIYRDDFVGAPSDGIGVFENASVAGVVSDGDDEFGRGHHVEGFTHRQFHIQRHRAGDDDHVGMFGGGDKANAKTLDVIVRIGEIIQLYFGGIVTAGINFADGQAAAEDGINFSFQFETQFLKIRVFDHRVGGHPGAKEIVKGFEHQNTPGNES